MKAGAGAADMQVSDDPQLLKLMIDDAKSAPEVFQPTNYWAVIEKAFLPELHKLGLQDFRRRNDSFLSSFGATDLSSVFGRINLSGTRILNNKITKRIPAWSKLLGYLNRLVNKALPIQTPYDVSAEGLKDLSYEFARMRGEAAGARPIDGFTASLAGNPEDTITVGDKVYTLSILYYYLLYAYCCEHMDFDSINLMVELGCGSGKQIEIIKKLHPSMCFLLFDIPPQLYVCEQYLTAVFPDSVVPYRETRQMECLPEISEGKIFIFGNWKFPLIQQVKIDLFWNAASFQEMEPDIVANYLSYVNGQASSAFLLEMMDGKGPVAQEEGAYGVLKQTKLEDYRKGLPDFRLVDQSPSWMALGKLQGYSNTFWEKVG